MKFWCAWSLVIFQVAFSTAYIDCPVQSYESACSLFRALQFIPTPVTGTGTAQICDAVVPQTGLAAEPTFAWLAAGTAPNIANTLFTLVVLDVDFVYPQLRGKGYLMHIRANLQGNVAYTTLPNTGAPGGTGTVLAAWRNSNYQKNQGRAHRIVALLFQHKSGTAQISTPVQDVQRPHFNLAGWLFRYRNQINCIPVDGTQIRVNA